MININVEAYAIVVDNEEKAYLKKKNSISGLNIQKLHTKYRCNINVSFDRDKSDKTYVSVSDLNTEEERGIY